MSRTASAIVDESRIGGEDPERDIALVVAARADLAAFEPLYRAYADRIYRYCLRRLDDPEQAADVTSTIFVKAMQSISTCQPGAFRSWLFAIAHNVTIDAQRARRVHAELEAAHQVASEQATPEEAALHSERRYEVVALLDHLTADQRQVVELRLAGLDGYEIAEVLGRSRASVDTAQSRALARLRKVLGVPAPVRRSEGNDVVAR